MDQEHESAIDALVAKLTSLGPGVTESLPCQCGGLLHFRVTDAKGSQWAHSEPVCEDWATFTIEAS